jgi:monooxygenase
VTILPAMCNSGAGHVTMLQRSPGYHINLPSAQPLNMTIRKWFPMKWANQIIRMRFLLQSYAFFYYCRLFPASAINLLRTGTQKELVGTNFTLEDHFTPSYRPWEQRMCISPDGDFFAALRAGKADVVTGHIDTITDRSIKLKNGKSIDDIDIIITATGLKVQLCGNASLSIDGEPLSVGDKFVWRGAMLQDVPVRNHPFQVYNSNMKPRTSLSSSATPTPHGRSVQMPPSVSLCD